ncbi:T9SS C-terminal target domain-containing protein [candidate division KSB1 bacterium]|nr:MAG: T9SS C-terminal target domain-containing protein [candidate division KSB1 bacterium]
MLTAYPNPFNSTTQIEFTLPVTQRVSLRLYDVLGREAATLLNERRTAGEHRASLTAAPFLPACISAGWKWERQHEHRRLC